MDQPVRTGDGEYRCPHCSTLLDFDMFGDELWCWKCGYVVPLERLPASILNEHFDQEE